MALRIKILLFFLLVCAAPFAVGFVVVDRMVFDVWSREVPKDVLADGKQRAIRISERMDNLVDAVAMVVGNMPLASFSYEQRGDALRAALWQVDDAVVLGLVDGRGRAVAPTAWIAEDEARALGRPALSEGERARFQSAVRIPRGGDAALGDVFFSDAGAPRLPVTVVVDGPRSHDWFVVAALDLSRVCAVVDQERRDEAVVGVDLVDRRGKRVCPGGKPVPQEAVDRARKARAPVVRRRSGPLDAAFASVIPIDAASWRLVRVVRPPDSLVRFSTVRAVAAAWLVACVLVAALVAAVLARTLTVPLRRLEEAARATAAGRWTRVPDVPGSRELQVVGTAFNQMVDELERWNRELQQRVEERTAELKRAQNQMIQAQKMAAIADLGAGLAHEINNPLTSVVGNAQMLMAECELPEGYRDMLKDLVHNARRIADVVDALLRYSQAQWGATATPVQLDALVEQVLAGFVERFKEKGAQFAWNRREPLRVLAVERDLVVLVSALIENALDAVGTGGLITVDVHSLEDGAVVLYVQDNGRGMSEEERMRAVDMFFTTHPPGSGRRGMGLSLAHRIAEEHGGTVELDPAPSGGTRVTVMFPAYVAPSRG